MVSTAEYPNLMFNQILYIRPLSKGHRALKEVCTSCRKDISVLYIYKGLICSNARKRARPWRSVHDHTYKALICMALITQYHLLLTHHS